MTGSPPVGDYPPGAGNPPGGDDWDRAGYQHGATPPTAGHPPEAGYPPGPYNPQTVGYEPAGYPPGASYPPPPLDGPSAPRKIRPGRVWYLVALGIFLAATTWLIFGVVLLVGTINDMQRVPLPVGGTVNLTESGSYIVYYEGPGAESGNIPSFDIHVEPVTPGAAASSLTPYESNVTYTVGAVSGRAVLTLEIASPGEFEITATGLEVAGAALAVGGSVVGGIIGIVVPALLMFLAVIGAGLVLLLRIVRKRALRSGYGTA